MIRRVSAAFLPALCAVASVCILSAAAAPQNAGRSTVGTAAASGLEQWQRVLLMSDYNTRVVVLGTTLLGCAAGMVGSFTLLRKRALMGDALSHATLPGIALAFILAGRIGLDGKSLVVLLPGAVISGLAGVGIILLLRRRTRIREDTAMGAVLSVFFGAGAALLGVIQQMPGGHQAGLESFIYGKTASMNSADVRLIGTAAAACILSSILFFKELKLLCFDEAFAGASGFPLLLLDMLLMALVVTVTIVGLQAVGLILMIALLVIPAAAARFWTGSLLRMFVISGVIGASSGWLGATVSAVYSNLPSGAMIVLVCAALFGISILLGTRRGVLVRRIRRGILNRAIRRQHLLRAVFELRSPTDPDDCRTSAVDFEQLLNRRSWSRSQLLSELRRCQSAELVEQVGDRVRLTRRGEIEARRLTRQHRLWELYLITHADVAPGRVDRDADAIEHVLEPEVVAELELLLEKETGEVPGSPHDLSADCISPEDNSGRVLSDA